MEAPFRIVKPIAEIDFPRAVPTVQYDRPIGPMPEEKKDIGEQILDAVGEFNRVVTSFTRNKAVRGANQFASDRYDAMDRNFGFSDVAPDYSGIMDMGRDWMEMGMPPSREDEPKHRRYKKNRRH